MNSVRVVTDSAADLPADMAAELEIAVVPLVIRFGTEIYLDGQLSQEEFWQKVEEGSHHPGTSQPSVGAFEEVFARLIEAGHQVLCLALTSKHSGTFSSACVAAQRFGEKVRVMDSLSLSMGQGLQVLAAAQAALQGIKLDEIVKQVEHIRERLRLFILLDTVEYLRRGGRADSLIPLLSRVTEFLKIKPILDIKDGRLNLHTLIRTYERGLNHIKEEVARLKPLESLAVLHIRCEEIAREMAHALAEKLDFPLERILIGEAGPVLAVHGGPHVLGVIVVPQGL